MEEYGSVNNDILDIYARIKEKVNNQVHPQIGIVLGSGLDTFDNMFSIIQEINLNEISGYPTATVSEHVGKVFFAKWRDIEIMIFQGRIHYYEGYSMNQVIMPIKLAYLFGVKTMILTNSAGAINNEYKVGDFVFIKDHISLFVPNCLRGQNDERFGVRFPDMTNVYDEEFNQKLYLIAKKKINKVHKGVYVQLSGPSFETPAEISMLRMMGADLVGMSTVCEAIACKYMGMKVCGISCVSNMAAGITDEEQSYEDVKRNAQIVQSDFRIVIDLILKEVRRSMYEN